MVFHTMSTCCHKSQKRYGVRTLLCFFIFIFNFFGGVARRRGKAGQWRARGMHTKKNEGKALYIAILNLQCSFMPNVQSM